MIRIQFDKALRSPGGTMNLSIDCTINEGDFITLYGPSGAGKTTLLRVIAGLTKPENGVISVGNEQWFNSQEKINLPPKKRSVGLVFQDYALFPNMTVKENIKFGLGSDNDVEEVERLVDLFKLEQLANQKPDTLSGGQKQRVALARSMASLPEILLLDEPMAALDFDMRIKIQNYLLEVHKKYNLTIILVSHDIGEIFKLSNTVMQLEDGRIINSGTPTQLFIEKETGGNFQFTGEVLSLSKEDVVYIVTVLIGKQIVKVVAEERSANQLNVGDKVLITAKAFNPIIQKLN